MHFLDGKVKIVIFNIFLNIFIYGILEAHNICEVLDKFLMRNHKVWIMEIVKKCDMVYWDLMLAEIQDELLMDVQGYSTYNLFIFCLSVCNMVIFCFVFCVVKMILFMNLNFFC